MTEDWPDKPIKVTDKNFDEFVEKYDMALIDCWAAWCGPCKMMDPVLEELAEEMQGKVVVGKLNVDKNRIKSSEYGVSSIPTMLVFKEGENVDRLIGAMPKQALKEKLKSYTN
ncbi:MAG: thioredoxin [Thermoplasmatota archaeon]